MKNKRGEEKIISIYWFFILIIVAGGIILMVRTFYNDPYDVREIEASLLAEKVANCIDLAGKMNPDLISNDGIFKPEFKDHFLSRCSLNFNSENELKAIQYYLEVNFYNDKNTKTSLFQLVAGNSNWKSDCDLNDKKYKRLVVCVKKKFYANDNSGRIYLVDILSMVNKGDKNVQG